jgi:hypothetical protein
MWSKFKAGTLIRNILKSNADILELVGDNIFPLIAPKDTVGDIIVYQRDKYSKEYTNMGVSSQQCLVNVGVISDDYDRSQELAELINDALEGSHDGNRIRLTDSTEDYADGKYLQVLVFSIE